MARKPKLPEDEKKIVNKIKEAFLMDFNKTQACIFAGCSRNYYYLLEERFPELINEFKACRENVKMQAKTTVKNAIPDDPKLALSYLKVRDKDFKEKSEVDHSGTVYFGDEFARLLSEVKKDIEKLKGE